MFSLCKDTKKSRHSNFCLSFAHAFIRGALALHFYTLTLSRCMRFFKNISITLLHFCAITYHASLSPQLFEIYPIARPAKKAVESWLPPPHSAYFRPIFVSFSSFFGLFPIKKHQTVTMPLPPLIFILQLILHHLPQASR